MFFNRSGQLCLNQSLKKQGFTIIEVMIAMTILAIGLLSIGTMQIAAVKGNKIAMDISKASYLAESKLEELLSLPFVDANVADANGDGALGLDAKTADTADRFEINGRYTLFWNIADDFPLNNTKTIKVIIVWRNKGVSKRLSIRNIRAG